MIRKAYVGGGCFWCIEAILQRLKGVLFVDCGYAGGHIDNPVYQEVITGLTGHAEIVKVNYNSEIISYHGMNG